MIKHLWFDFSDTIARINKEESEKIFHSSYATTVGKELTPELIHEYKELVKQYKSNSAVFASLGLPATFLADQTSKMDPHKIYQLIDAHIPEVVQKLKDIVPVSIFSNNRLDTLLPALSLELEWFTHILGPDAVKKPKPDLEGFNKMIELSGVPADEILYIGDNVEKDLVPAKKVGIATGLLWAQSSEADYCFADFQDILSLVQKGEQDEANNVVTRILK